MMGHWHVATGLAGYAPDGSDGFTSVDTLSGLCYPIQVEIRDSTDGAFDDIAGLRENRAFEEAWEVYDKIQELDVIHASFNGERKNAPLYGGDDDKWDAEILRLVEKHFPLDLDKDSRIQLHVWQCETEDDKCEHLQDDE